MKLKKIAANCIIGSKKFSQIVKDGQANDYFLFSIKNGDWFNTSVLLRYACIDVNVKTDDDLQQTGLHISAERGYYEIVKMLLENDADVNIKDYWGGTPIENAFCNEHFEEFKLLVEYNADIQTIFPLACSNIGYSKYVQLMLEKIPKINNYVVVLSLRHVYDINTLNLLISCNTDVNERDDDFGYTPLHCADKHPEIMQVLINNGANVNAKCNDGNTPLHLASYNVQVQPVKVLIQNGADMFIKNNFGRTPQDIARKEVCLDVLNYFDQVFARRQIFFNWLRSKVCSFNWLRRYKNIKVEVDECNTVTIIQTNSDDDDNGFGENDLYNKPKKRKAFRKHKHRAKRAKNNQTV
jgi:ankyrin repeat protein